MCTIRLVRSVTLVPSFFLRAGGGGGEVDLSLSNFKESMIYKHYIKLREHSKSYLLMLRTVYSLVAHYVVSIGPSLDIPIGNTLYKEGMCLGTFISSLVAIISSILITNKLNVPCYNLLRVYSLDCKDASSL